MTRYDSYNEKLHKALPLKNGLPAPTHFLEIKKLQLETYPEIRKGPKIAPM